MPDSLNFRKSPQQLRLGDAPCTQRRRLQAAGRPWPYIMWRRPRRTSAEPQPDPNGKKQLLSDVYRSVEGPSVRPASRPSTLRWPPAGHTAEPWRPPLHVTVLRASVGRQDMPDPGHRGYTGRSRKKGSQPADRPGPAVMNRSCNPLRAVFPPATER